MYYFRKNNIYIRREHLKFTEAEEINLEKGEKWREAGRYISWRSEIERIE